ncbi:MAG: hypothetical protein KDB14_20355 [Planctomycetales bacterium]|nr:hypothetical protein [Planctomycetales bacterium]
MTVGTLKFAGELSKLISDEFRECSQVSPLILRRQAAASSKKAEFADRRACFGEMGGGNFAGVARAPQMPPDWGLGFGQQTQAAAGIYFSRLPTLVDDE